MTVLTLSFLGAMGVLFLISIPAQFPKPTTDGGPSRWAAFGAAAPNLLTTIGVFGTFVGILVGLQGFDVTNVDESVPALLDGLKTAFWTSAAGLGAAIALRILQPFGGKSSSSASEDPIDVLKAIDLKIAAQTKALSGGEDSSLLTQLQKLRTSVIDGSAAEKAAIEDGFAKQLEAFNSFAAQITENNSKALIEALKEVIRDFNAKINEQFGENFKHLNEAVGKLLEWQVRYKEYIEQTETVLRLSSTSLDASSQSMNRAAQAMSDIPKQAQEVRVIIDSLLEQMKLTNDMASGVRELREGLKNALPEINANINALTTSFAEQVENSAQALQQSASETGSQLELAGTSLRRGVEQLQDSMEQSFEEFDKAVQQELQRVISLMGQQLASISEKLTDDFKELADALERAR